MVQRSAFVNATFQSVKHENEWVSRSYHILESNLQCVWPEVHPLRIEQTPHAQGLEPDHTAQTQLCKNNSDQQPDKADQEQFAANGRGASNDAYDSCGDDDASNDCTAYRRKGDDAREESHG